MAWAYPGLVSDTHIVAADDAVKEALERLADQPYISAALGNIHFVRDIKESDELLSGTTELMKEVWDQNESLETAILG